MNKPLAFLAVLGASWCGPASAQDPSPGLLGPYLGTIEVKPKGSPVGVGLNTDGKVFGNIGLTIPLKGVDVTLGLSRRPPEPARPKPPAEAFGLLVNPMAMWSEPSRVWALEGQLRQKDEEIRKLKAELDEAKRKLAAAETRNLLGAPIPAQGLAAAPSSLGVLPFDAKIKEVAGTLAAGPPR